MNITKKVLKNVECPYAVSAYTFGDRKKVICATEVDGPCVGIWADTLEEELIWDGFGGTMNTCQLNENGDFLAIQRFYNGFICRDACIVHMRKKADNSWSMTEVLEIPFCHRICVIPVGTERYVIASVLANDKQDEEDWSQPGRVELYRLNDEGFLVEKQILLSDFHKNHGLYAGTLNGEQVVIVTGVEGVYKISVPSVPGQPWETTCLIKREISDCTVIDLDGDGADELITIEEFHGNRVVVNKLLDNKWEEVYSYPVEFGHAIWSGVLLGKPSFLIGYRSSNAALLKFSLRKKSEGDWFMDVSVIDEHESPTNIAVVHEPDKEKVFCCSGGKHRIVLYELT